MNPVDWRRSAGGIDPFEQVCRSYRYPRHPAGHSRTPEPEQGWRCLFCVETPSAVYRRAAGCCYWHGIPGGLALRRRVTELHIHGRTGDNG